MLERFDMHNCKPHETLVAKEDKFSLNKCPKLDLEVQEIQKVLYASVVGSLMYAQVCTKFDLSFILVCWADI